MASLDYTNIAGGTFQPYVANQIEYRKILVKKSTRTPQELIWLTNKSAWIRISSGVDVDSTNTNFLEKGSKLSKKYILQGGLLDHSVGESYNLRSGVGSNKAYGIGGTDFGFTPMPGLTDISIKTGGKLGTLKEITFNFICYNMEQLNIMESLYMKLGFGVLVEWGHTSFINAKGQIDTTMVPLPFYDIKTKEDLLEKITKYRKDHAGNYDASWGTVKNFSYSLDGNGRFKCQVQLVGAGDILESLKINISAQKEDPPPQAPASIYPVVSDATLSLLNEALYDIFDVTGVDASVDFIIDENHLSTIQPYFKNIGLDIINWDSNSTLKKYGYHFRLINDPSAASNIPAIPNSKLFFSRLIADYNVPEEDVGSQNVADVTKPGLPQVYITLGHLLLLIMSTGMIYHRNEGESQDKQRPYIYIDVNTETNRCYTFEGHCSLDPGVCLIGSNQLPFGITTNNFDKLKTNFTWLDDNGTGGRFMWTLVNVDFVASILRKWRNTSIKGDIIFIDLIKDILDGISKATGGYNEFRVVPDDDSRCIRILDDRRMAGISVPEYTEIPVLGKESLVYNFNYTSKIAPNTAAMVVVAAQAQPYKVQGAENALAFSHLNRGLTNRLDTVIVDSGTEHNQVATTDTSAQRYVELRDYIEFLYSGAGTGFSVFASEEEFKEAVEEVADIIEEKKPEEQTVVEKFLDFFETDGDTIRTPAKEIPKLFELYTIKISDDLKKAAIGKASERGSRGEVYYLSEAAQELIKFYKEAQAETGTEKKQELIDALYKFPKLQNPLILTPDYDVNLIYLPTEEDLAYAIHYLLSKKYKEKADIGLFTFSDTTIETIWDDIANKSIGDNQILRETWY